MTVTADQMNRMFPNTGKFADAINKTVDNYEINNVAMFVAQIGHESGELKHFNENLNYSAERLLEVFPRYFNESNVDEYDHSPVRIGNRIYANRMGNGDEASGDGYKYHGRGAMQLTGKENYKAFADDVGMNMDDVVTYLETDEGAFMSAGFFWYNNNLNDVSSDIIKTTKKINGGTNGLAQRTAFYNKAKSIFD